MSAYFLRLCLLICAKFKSKFLLTFWVSKNTFKFDGVDKLGRSHKLLGRRSKTSSTFLTMTLQILINKSLQC